MRKLRKLRLPLLLLLLLMPVIRRFLPKDGSRFGIEPLQSSMDYNQNGLDDYADFLAGARKDAKNRPTYDPA